MATQSRHPRLPLPPPMIMSESGSFAHFTLTQRMPDIVRRVIVENDFCLEIEHNLEKLIKEIPEKKVNYIQDNGQDIADWRRYLQPSIDKKWLDIPWFFAEAYFYRRILEASHYFIPGKTFGKDPYRIQKRRGLASAMLSIRELSTRVNEWNKSKQQDNSKSLTALLYFTLWGNRADMSLFPLNAEDNNNCPDIYLEQSHILVDDTPLIVDKLARFKEARIDFIVDNAGLELIGDLYLADFLLANQLAEVVYLHLKPYPTFVSDATIQDVQETLKVLKGDAHQEVQLIANRLQDYMNQGRLLCLDHYFWTSPLFFGEMPEALTNELRQSSLILIKGDANYRRCLGDRQWPFTTAFTDIVNYFPAPIAALRTLKSELAVGLQLEQVEGLNNQDHHWLTSGKWGVIQFTS